MLSDVSEPIIQVENLGKRYMLSHRGNPHDGLRHRIENFARSPLRRLRSTLNSPSPARNGNGSVHKQPATKEEFWALKDVSFEIKQGEVVGIIGRNGAGKSTLLKILSRITEPTTGRAIINGRVASLLEVGTGFHPELSGRENIFLNGAILGMSKAEIKRKFDEIVDFAEIEKFLDTPVKHYSSGMYVRLAFAVAANLESEILMVDEVLAVGDAQFQKKCMGKMQEVTTHNGRTVLFVSHNAGAISALCSTGILLQAGRCVVGGDIREVLREYNSQGTKDLIEFSGDVRKPCITSVAIDQKNLLDGDFTLEVSFASPFPLNPPIIGVVVSNSLGVPVFGSNPLMHPDGFSPKPMTSGIARVRVSDLPVHPGEYRVTVFLGESGSNYEIRRDVISFDFIPRVPVVNCPPVESIGPLNVEARWELQ
jgi:lipopolysaccharide transport system ATP-binding protein